MSQYSEAQAVERFLTVVRRRRNRFPFWLNEMTLPDQNEQRQGANAVAVTDIGRLHVRVEGTEGAIDQFNYLFPENQAAAVIIFPSYSDDRIWDKSLHFIGRRRQRERSRRPR